MKIKNIIKLIVGITVIFAYWPTQNQPTQAVAPFKAKIDISKFIYYSPNSELDPTLSTNADASANYDPRFNIADIPTGDTYDMENIKEKAENKVFPFINGSMFYRVKLLENMILLNVDKEFAQAIINLSKNYKWASEEQRLNAYFIYPTRYSHFLKTIDRLKLAIMATNEVPIFFPGISYTLPPDDKVFPDTVMNTLRTRLNVKETSSNKFFFHLDGIKKMDDISFGACYKINPPGKANACFNTSKQNCAMYAKNTTVESDGSAFDEKWVQDLTGITPPTLSDMEAKHIYFLHGISCEKIDLLLKNPSSRTNTKTVTTEKTQYYMLLYFHGYYMEGVPGKYTTLTAEQTEERFASKVFNTNDMKKIQPNYITIWVNEPNKEFKNSASNWGTVPFNEIINKSYEYCKNDTHKGNATWDKTKKITIDANFSATVNCGYNPSTANVPQNNIKVIAAGHSSGGTVINQALKNNNIYFSVLLDALYYSPATEASTCTKWNAIQANKTGEKTAISDGQPQLSAWKTLCPNGIIAGSTTAHDDIIKDLPSHLGKKFTLSTTSVQEQLPQEQIPDAPLKEKTLFDPQVKFAGIKAGINLPEYINLMYKYLVTFALVITGFIIVIGGAKYMMGQNDGIPMIRNAFIGFILLSSTYVILKTVNPAAVNMDIIEISEIGRNTIKATTSNTGAAGTTISGATVAAGENRSPDPPIAINSGWYFPVIIPDVDVKNFKYNATNKKAGGSFGYFRRTNEYALKNSPNFPVVCHHAVDIYTNKPGRVVAITDGIVVASGNNFANCSGGQTGSIIIEHKDKNGKSFFARYGEVDIVDMNQFKKGATVTAGQTLGNATRCGMLHFELHARAGVTPKWRMPVNLWPTILNELGYSDSIKNTYKLEGGTITNLDKIKDDSSTTGKNCLDSPTALNHLINDKSSVHGQYLLNPSSFLIELWNQTGAQGKQTNE